MDIELRWLEKRRRTGAQDAEGNWITETGYHATRTLQYRTRVMTMGAIPVGAGDGNTYVMHEKPMGWTWTEWKDLPTEVVYV